MTTITIALAQFSSRATVAENLEYVRGTAAKAAQGGAQLVVFPEAAMVPFDADLRAVAEDLDGSFASAIREIATTNNIQIALGMFTHGAAEPGATRERIRNTLLVTGPHGEATYNKIHLFDAFGSRESASVQGGDEAVLLNVAGVSVGLSLCFDVRFPALYQALGRAGAQAIIVSASWGAGPGKVDQWELLTRARAADAQTFVFACGQAYTEPRGKAALGVGHSLVADPTGAAIANAGDGEELVFATIDTDEVDAVRERVPLVDQDFALPAAVRIAS